MEPPEPHSDSPSDPPRDPADARGSGEVLPAWTHDLRRAAGRPRLVVDRRALRHNADLLRRAACSPRLCAVVKADAYGHGAAGVADALLNVDPVRHPMAFADALAVATIEEALELTAACSPEVPVMVLRPVECVYAGDNRALVEAAVQAGVMLSLVSPASADDVARVAERLGVRGHVGVMLDTGMCREGVSIDQFAAVLGRVRSHPPLRLVAVGTHFTDGDCEDDPATDEQLRRFHDAVATVEGELPPHVVRHAANSGGSLLHEDAGLDMIRPGLSLYGIDPCGTAFETRPLRPAARWEAPLWTIRDVPAGTSVGYNRAWRADRDTRIGLIPVGYADGYPRALGGNALVRVPSPDGGKGTYCPVVGRVSMDYLTIDVGGAPWARPGDRVVLMDDDPAGACSVYRLAEKAGTIPYEFFTGIGRRVTRVYVGD